MTFVSRQNPILPFVILIYMITSGSGRGASFAEALCPTEAWCSPHKSHRCFLSLVSASISSKTLRSVVLRRTFSNYHFCLRDKNFKTHIPQRPTVFIIFREKSFVSVDNSLLKSDLCLYIPLRLHRSGFRFKLSEHDRLTLLQACQQLAALLRFHTVYLFCDLTLH